MEYDLIVIGAGPAGMTAGVFGARKGLKTVIVSEDVGGQVNGRPTSRITWDSRRSMARL